MGLLETNGCCVDGGLGELNAGCFISGLVVTLLLAFLAVIKGDDAELVTGPRCLLDVVVVFVAAMV